MLWDRADYDTQYFPDTYVVTGHTPTQHIAGNPNPGYIYRRNNHIAIDCGASIPGGRLAAICLDTGEEFYVSSDMDCKQEQFWAGGKGAGQDFDPNLVSVFLDNKEKVEKICKSEC